jgi:hypothetical protein
MTKLFFLFLFVETDMEVVGPDSYQGDKCMVFVAAQPFISVINIAYGFYLW